METAGGRHMTPKQSSVGLGISHVGCFFMKLDTNQPSLAVVSEFLSDGGGGEVGGGGGGGGGGGQMEDKKEWRNEFKCACCVCVSVHVSDIHHII